jgi:ankyrin repeat protein
MRWTLLSLILLCTAPSALTLDTSSISVDGSTTLTTPRILSPPEQESVDTNLLMAAMAGSQERYSEALAEGGNPNAMDSMGRNALTLAAINGKALLVKDILRDGRCEVNPSLMDLINERITQASEDGDNDLMNQLSQVLLAYKRHEIA